MTRHGGLQLRSQPAPCRRCRHQRLGAGSGVDLRRIDFGRQHSVVHHHDPLLPQGAQCAAAALAASVAAYEPALVASAAVNAAWIWAARACSSWNRAPWLANCTAVSIDTSSTAAGTTPVVGAAAAAVPAVKA